MSHRKDDPQQNNLARSSGESDSDTKRPSPPNPPAETPDEETVRRRVVIPGEDTPDEADSDRNPNQQDHFKKKGK